MKKEASEMANGVGFLGVLYVKHSMTPGLCTERGYGWTGGGFFYFLSNAFQYGFGS